jgi:RND family efflux transporter MFP subunit
LTKPKRIIVTLVVVVAGAFGAMQIYRAYQKEKAAAASSKKGAAERVVAVGVAQARRGSVRDEILLTGSLRPKEQVEVTAKVTGRVEKLAFELGDPVGKGDLIAELDSDELQQQVHRASAALAVARASSQQRRAQLENSKADLERAEMLLKEGLIPRQEFESRRTAYQVVEAQLDLARAQEREAQAELNELEIRLSQSKIYAPMSGHVARRHVDVGALVSPATPIISLVNLSTMVTMANVPEREVGKLRVGNKATIEVDAFGNTSFAGRVARIGPVLDPSTRSATVEVEIPNPDAGLKAEMFVRVMLDLGSTRPAILIPREALVYRGQQAGVYLDQSGTPVFIPVDTGLTVDSEVEVSSLKPGTRIIARGATMLREGDRIRIVEGKDAQEASALPPNP